MKDDMGLVPELEAFLELVEFGRLSGKRKALHELTPQAARTDFEAAAQALDQPLPGLDPRLLSFVSRDGHPLHARLYRQDEGDGLQPVLLYWHGGGYVVGSLDSHDALCRRLAALGRFAVLAVDYRLAPEWRFPTAVEDAEDAVVWLGEAAVGLGLDPTRVAFGGDSVGASLATVQAISAARSTSASKLRPRGQLLLYPVTDATSWRASHRDFASGYLLETATLEWFYRNYARAPEDLADWRCSPLLAAALTDLAPVLIHLAGHDPLHDEGLAYAQRLQACGNEVRLIDESGLTHDFARMAGLLPEVADRQQHWADWLAERLND